MRRHTEIVRDVARELSNAPDREDRPASGTEAKTRFEAYLARLAQTPRTGLAAATGMFIDTLLARTQRYGAHLFVCFDDPRIPATTNELEGFFGGVKALQRRSLGTGSTTNSVVINLGTELLAAYQYVRRPGAMARVRAPTAPPRAFSEARAQLARGEESSTRRRSLVRNFDAHVRRLRKSVNDASGG